MTWFNYLGSYASVAALWESFPEGGIEGDYAKVGNDFYGWNQYTRQWQAISEPDDAPDDEDDEEEEQEPLPPVSFYVDRKKRTITCTIASDGKTWKNSEVMARLAVFSADDFFSLRDTTNALFASDRALRESTAVSSDIPQAHLKVRKCPSLCKWFCNMKPHPR